MKVHTQIRIENLSSLLTAILTLFLVWPGGALAGEIISNFNDSTPNWDRLWRWGDDSLNFTQTLDGQLKGTSGAGGNIGGVDWDRILNIRENQTLELRVDIVKLTADNVQLGWGQNDGDATRTYSAYISRSDVFRVRFGKTTVYSKDNIVNSNFITREDQEVSKIENVVLVLGLTGKGDSVEIYVRVLDKDADNNVIFQWTGIDTNEVDPLPSGFDPGPPFKNGTAAYLAFQPLSGQESSEVILDNLEFGYLPNLSASKAIYLTWPATAEPYNVYGAPNTDGPWELVTEPVHHNQVRGIYQLAVPAESGMEFFRLLPE